MTPFRNLLALAVCTLPLGAAAQDRGPDGWPGMRGPQSALDRAGHATVDPDGWRPVAPACPPDACGPDDGPFACGTTSVQYLIGGFCSGRPGPEVPSFDYVLASARFGWVATPVEDRWIGRGAYEWLLDLSAAGVTTSGYGDYFFRQSVYLRHNWVEPGSRLVPYLQLGFGAIYTDTYKDRSQGAIGQQIEFITRLEAGLHYFVAPNMSLDVEGGLQHISNAGHAERNDGVNAWGGQIGLTYYFPAGR